MDFRDFARNDVVVRRVSEGQLAFASRGFHRALEPPFKPLELLIAARLDAAAIPRQMSGGAASRVVARALGRLCR
ncbi:ABC-type polar amino acid transport system ATPase subunit [Methylopila capsulata]|uniref:ABC-type polar amino acid transport system ATPase subunit n=1 Tax=Methylopila capsulata TaxID=61654 RepID=A0ABS2T5U1_9HYPH|nr:hypothetical protein [Methylopila capsulata]MBM7850720.1 ABC-type polar amino acid transport system ATPase subunit [Methylopila capsulata]